MWGVPSSLLSAPWKCSCKCVHSQSALAFPSQEAIWLPLVELARRARVGGGTACQGALSDIRNCCRPFFRIHDPIACGSV